jgi:hypothetical protein
MVAEETMIRQRENALCVTNSRQLVLALILHEEIEPVLL